MSTTGTIKLTETPAQPRPAILVVKAPYGIPREQRYQMLQNVAACAKGMTGDLHFLIVDLPEGWTWEVIPLVDEIRLDEPDREA